MCERSVRLKRIGVMGGLLTLFWRQGLKRPSRAVFWQQLADILTDHPLILTEYIWLLMLNEHFIDYQQMVVRQVEEQLACARTHRVHQQLAISNWPSAAGLASKKPTRRMLGDEP